MQVRSDEQGCAALLFQKHRELGRGSGLARTVQADDQNARRLFEIERGGVASEECGQLVVKNLHDLLPGRDAPQNFFAQRLLFHARDETLRHLEIDIRFQERQPHLPQGIVDVRLRDRTMPAQVLENILKLVAEL